MQKLWWKIMRWFIQLFPQAYFPCVHSIHICSTSGLYKVISNPYPCSSVAKQISNSSQVLCTFYFCAHYIILQSYLPNKAMIATLDRIIQVFVCLKTNINFIFLCQLYISTLLEIQQMNLIEPVFGVVLNKAPHHAVAYTIFVSLLFI